MSTPKPLSPGSQSTAASIPGPATLQPVTPPPDVSLSELDSAMAAEMDQMLEGDFESIDAVLDSVFQDQAVLVQPADGSPATSNAKVRAAPPPAPVAAPSPKVMDKPAAPPASPAPPAPPAPPAAHHEVAESDAIFDALPAALNEPAPAPVLKQHIAEPEPAPVAIVPQPLPPAPKVASVPATATVAPKSAPSSGGFNWHALLQPLVRVLAMLNLPLRYVPPAMRPAVDWVALSLLVWVPIVWVMALTGLGSASPHSGAEHAEAAHHESAPAYDQKDSHTKDAEGHGGGH